MAEGYASGLPFNYADLSGGFNTYNAYDDLADNEARDLLNVQGTTAGAITKRNGLQTIVTIRSGMQSVWGSQNLQALIVADNNGGNITSVNIPAGTTTSLATGMSSGMWEWVYAPVVSGQGPVYGMDGLSTPKQTDGLTTMANWTATDVGGSVPNGRYVAYHKNQVFVSGVNANRSRVYWSGLGDPTAWNPANNNGSGFMDFDPNDGEVITAIRPMGSYLLVAKPSKLWVLIDTATATSRPVSQSVGCMSHRAMRQGAAGMYVLSRDRGVYLTDGSKVTPISDKIQPTFDSISDRTIASGFYFNGHYYLSVSQSGGNNDLILDYDERLNSWWKHQTHGDGGGVEQFAVTSLASNSNKIGLYCVSQANTHVNRAFTPGVFQDNGTNYPWSWSGPWQSPSFYRRRRFPTPFFRKRVKQIRYDGLGQVDLSLCQDFNTTPTLIASDIFANSSITKEGRVYGQGVANVWSAVFSGTYSTQAQLNQYTLFMGDRKDSMP